MTSRQPNDNAQPQTIRVVMQQPALPAYRVPVFAELARRPGIAFKLAYGVQPDLPNVEPNGFEGWFAPIRSVPVLGRRIYWHAPQWQFATKRTTDVLVLTWNVQFASLLPSLRRARRHGVGTVLWGHGYSKSEAAWRANIRAKVARLATAVMFYNHTAARQYINAGFDPDRVFVAPNSIDQEPIARARAAWLAEPAKLHAFRREQELGQGPVVLFVSRLDPANRLDVMIEALPMLAASHPEVKLIVIGRGDAEQARLTAIAEKLHVMDRVRFLGAVRDEMKLAPWFLTADAFCYPANIGLSILHAMGYGLPVVTGNDIASHNPEIEAHRDGENGLLFDHGNPESLAATLQRVFDDRALRTRLSEGALATVRQRYNVQAMVDGMEQAIRYAFSHAGHIQGAGGK